MYQQSRCPDGRYRRTPPLLTKRMLICETAMCLFCLFAGFQWSRHQVCNQEFVPLCSAHIVQLCYFLHVYRQFAKMSSTTKDDGLVCSSLQIGMSNGVDG